MNNFHEKPWKTVWIKYTWYVWGQNSKNRQLLDILACNSANDPSFQNQENGFLTDFEKIV